MPHVAGAIGEDNCSTNRLDRVKPLAAENLDIVGPLATILRWIGRLVRNSKGERVNVPTQFRRLLWHTFE